VAEQLWSGRQRDAVGTADALATGEDFMSNRNTGGRLRALLLAGASLVIGGNAAAQQADPVVQEDEDIVVIGSHIGGVGDSGVLPVTVVDREDLDAIGGQSAGELLIYAPAVGDVEFADNNTGTNGARGDVTGANLRGLGSGRTLTLVNGRRIAPHPQSEAVDSVPV
jgi:outer membrane cobalamin receptor